QKNRLQTQMYARTSRSRHYRRVCCPDKDNIGDRNPVYLPWVPAQPGPATGVWFGAVTPAPTGPAEGCIADEDGLQGRIASICFSVEGTGASHLFGRALPPQIAARRQ